MTQIRLFSICPNAPICCIRIQSGAVPRWRPVIGENSKIEERGYDQIIYTVILPFSQRRGLVGMEIQRKGVAFGLAEYEKQDRETVAPNPILIVKNQTVFVPLVIPQTMIHSVRVERHRGVLLRWH